MVDLDKQGKMGAGKISPLYSLSLPQVTWISLVMYCEQKMKIHHPVTVIRRFFKTIISLDCVLF